MEPNCAFCSIVARKLPAQIIHETERIVVFPSIEPKAPVHLLVVPKQHIESLAHAEAHTGLLGELLETLRRVAQEQGIAERGYKIVMNTGRDGGQSIPHLHVHLLGGADVSGIT